MWKGEEEATEEEIMPLGQKKLKGPMDTSSTSASTSKAAESTQKKLCRKPTNPLLVDIILDQLLKFFLDRDERERISIIRDLKSCRLVCKLWKDRVTPFLGEICPPVQFGTRDTTEPQLPDIALNAFMKVMRNSDQIPVSKFNIEESICVADSGSKRLFQEFINRCGPSTVELCFQADNLNNLYCPVEDTKKVVMQFKNLKVLRLSSGDYYLSPFQSEENGDFLYFLEWILTTVANLEEIEFEISKYSCWYGEEVNKVAELLTMCPRSISRLSVQTSFMNNLHFDVLTEKQLKLEKLDLTLMKFGCSKEEIYKFFEKQSETLKAIRLGGEIELPLTEFPKMKELEHIHLREMKNDVIPIPIRFSNISAKLSILNLSGILSESDCDKLVSCPDVATTITDLTLPCRLPPLSWLHKAAKYFPNVKKLRFEPSITVREVDCVFQDIFCSFVDVEELHVIFSRQPKLIIYFHSEMPMSMSEATTIDALFSGVSEQDYKQIIQQGNFDNVDLSMYQTQPSILNMTRLKKLMLSNTCANGSPTFSLFAGYFIFSNMANLEDVELRGNIQVTPECEMILRNKVNKFFIGGPAFG